MIDTFFKHLFLMARMVNLWYVPNMTCQTILLCLPLQKYRCVQHNDSRVLGCDAVWLRKKLQTFQWITVSSSLGPRECFWTACCWSWRNCDPFPRKELLAQHTASHHTRSESSETQSCTEWACLLLKRSISVDITNLILKVLFLVNFVHYHLLI